MKHIALICPAIPGHLNPMTALGREFLRRGYSVTLVALPDAGPKAQAAGLNFEPFGQAEFPPGALARSVAELGELDGAAALRHTLGHYAKEAMAALRDIPAILKRIGADAALIDQTQPVSGAAEIAGIPWVTVCCALALNPEASVPPWSTDWPFDPTPEGRARNVERWEMGAALFGTVLDTINQVRRGAGLTDLAPWNSVGRGGDSPLATVAQQPAFFDFPRTALPANFHYTGPFHDPHPASANTPDGFPWDRLAPSRPLIYASMGTLQNRQQGVFRTIAEACADTDAQLLISLGRRDAEVAALADLPGAPVVVPFAPQVEVLRRSALTITHAGLNTALESLAQGVPMVAIPITNDQPGVAARVRYIGAGEFVPLASLMAESLGAAVRSVLTKPGYRAKAEWARETMAAAGPGVILAADIAEKAFQTGQPVYRA